MWHHSRCFAQMLVMGFPLARSEKLPKTWVVRAWERALLACSSTCHHSQASETPWLSNTRRDFVLKQFLFRNAYLLWLELFLQEFHGFKEPYERICLARMKFLLKIKVWEKTTHQQHNWLGEDLGAHCHRVPTEPQRAQRFISLLLKTGKVTGMWQALVHSWV